MTLLGVTPKAFLNVRLKCAASLKPQRNATSVAVSERPERESFSVAGFEATVADPAAHRRAGVGEDEVQRAHRDGMRGGDR